MEPLKHPRVFSRSFANRWASTNSLASDGTGAMRNGGRRFNGGFYYRPRRGFNRRRGGGFWNRRGRGGRGGRGGRDRKPQISKDDLDKEIDAYMKDTKSALDKDLDEYMEQSK